jgi:hypothetical protein
MDGLKRHTDASLRMGRLVPLHRFSTTARRVVFHDFCGSRLCHTVCCHVRQLWLHLHGARKAVVTVVGLARPTVM